MRAKKSLMKREKVAIEIIVCVFTWNSLSRVDNFVFNWHLAAKNSSLSR